MSGAANNDTIHLGSSADTVVVGGAGETVKGGGGADNFIVTKETIGATIDGGTGSSTLTVTGGGTVALGPRITHIGQVTLQAASSAYNFTADATAGLTVNDQSTGQDTIAASGAGQTLTGGAARQETMVGADAGTTTFRDSAIRLNGDTIRNFVASDTIDIYNVAYQPGRTTVGFTANEARTGGDLTLSQDGKLQASVTLFGQMLSSFTAKSDGHDGTMITPATQTPFYYSGSDSVMGTFVTIPIHFAASH